MLADAWYIGAIGGRFDHNSMPPQHDFQQLSHENMNMILAHVNNGSARSHAPGNTFQRLCDRGIRIACVVGKYKISTGNNRENR